jgi:ElaB/YqjD/DUF883 family membrane-anchored ribosome-binding protein
MEQGSTAGAVAELNTRNGGASPSTLTDRLETMEQGVKDMAHDATEAVRETLHTAKAAAQSVKGAMHDGVASVTHALDPSRLMREHPWLVLGGAALAGFLVSYWVGRARRESA